MGSKKCPARFLALGFAPLPSWFSLPSRVSCLLSPSQEVPVPIIANASATEVASVHQQTYPNGLVLVAEGLRHKFMKQLRSTQMSARTRRVVRWLGTIGTSARGVVFALAGVLVIDAAVTHDAAKSGGVDKALLTLRDQPFGEVLLILAALGLVIFGAYGLCEARWRKV